MLTGKVYLCGAGPGDPGWITSRALECLRAAEVLYYDPAVNTLLLQNTMPECSRTAADFSLMLDSEECSRLQKQLAAQVNAGLRVMCLFAGDPLSAPHGTQLALSLAAANIPFEIVPGISAALAGPAAAGIPATHRGVSAAVTQIHLDSVAEAELAGIDWPALAGLGGTLIFELRNSAPQPILKRLLAAGLPETTPVALIAHATLPGQQTKLETVRELSHTETGEFQPPLVLAIGNVTELHRVLGGNMKCA